MPACRHLKTTIGSIQTPFGLEPEFGCAKHDQTTLCRCATCKDYLPAMPVDSTAFQRAEAMRAANENPHPPGAVVDRYGKPAGVGDLYRGASAFLVLGGPSLKKMPLDLLRRRGVLIMSCNNNPAALPVGLRPHIWLHTDPCRKFHDSIWRDPSVLKFTPVREWGAGRGGKKALRTRGEGGKLVNLPGDMAAKDMPGVFGFERNTAFTPKDFLWEPSINRGNDEQNALGMKKGKKIGEANGWPKTINTMFAALRLAFYLGIRNLYLLGCDFHMDPATPYAFGQAKNAGGVSANNSAFASMCVMFDGLLPYFEANDFHVYNSTPNSGLYSFEYVPLNEAVHKVTQGFEEMLNAEGWYDS